MPGEDAANFCYQCGKRLMKGKHACWYCSAPVRGDVRPNRRCPFCSEPIRPEAVKCRHCGEFLDGRTGKQPPGGPAGPAVIYIEKPGSGAAPVQLVAGSRVPAEVAKGLDPNTVLAIEHNRPDLISEPGVLALPSPSMIGAAPKNSPRADEGGSYIDVDVGDPPTPPSPNTPALGDNTPAKRGGAAKAVALGAGGLVGKGVGLGARWALTRLKGGSKAQPREGRQEWDLDDPYRICPNCNTEIMASDNFCYQCGAQFKRSRFDLLHEAAQRRRHSNKGIHIVSVALILAQIGVGAGWAIPFLGPVDKMWAYVICALVVLLNAAGWVRRPGTFNLLVALALIAVSAGERALAFKQYWSEP